MSANAAKIETIYKQHGGAVRRRVRQIVKDVDEAEDITHAAFEKLLNQLNGELTVRSERALLFAMATNMALNHLRHRSVVNRHADAVAHHDHGLRCDASVAPGVRALEDAGYDALEAAIRSLPDKCRTAFVLCKLKGMSYRQAAEQMSVSEHMIKKHVQRGMALCAQRAPLMRAQTLAENGQ